MSTTPPTSRCRSCGAQIIWAATSNGKRMPIDAAPHPDGNCVITTTARTSTVTVDSGPSLLDAPGTTRHQPHWATCQQANQWKTP